MVLYRVEKVSRRLWFLNHEGWHVAGAEAFLVWRNGTDQVLLGEDLVFQYFLIDTEPLTR